LVGNTRTLVLTQETEIIPPKFYKNTFMRNFINKNSITAFMFAAIMSVASAASAVELTSPVNMEQVGKMKFLVRAEPKSSLVVIIYDAENNILYNEVISNQKVFSFSDLSDGKYRMDILNSHKKLVQSKSFNIQTEVKRDLVASK
jgi:hypothetical protein